MLCHAKISTKDFLALQENLLADSSFSWRMVAVFWKYKKNKYNFWCIKLFAMLIGTKLANANEQMNKITNVNSMDSCMNAKMYRLVRPSPWNWKCTDKRSLSLMQNTIKPRNCKHAYTSKLAVRALHIHNTWRYRHLNRNDGEPCNIPSHCKLSRFVSFSVYFCFGPILFRFFFSVGWKNRHEGVWERIMYMVYVSTLLACIMWCFAGFWQRMLCRMFSSYYCGYICWRSKTLTETQKTYTRLFFYSSLARSRHAVSFVRGWYSLFLSS